MTHRSGVIYGEQSNVQEDESAWQGARISFEETVRGRSSSSLRPGLVGRAEVRDRGTSAAYVRTLRRCTPQGVCTYVLSRTRLKSIFGRPIKSTRE
jgi:hypothetical protein